MNSYHRGYPASDKIMEGIKGVFKEENIDLKTFFLDTKNNPGSEKVNAKVEDVLREINRFKPDAIIASDDAAVKYVIAPWFKNKKIPVIFCGVNWSADQYELPADHITGMLEVLPLRENLQVMRRYYPAAKRLTVLSEKSLSEEKNKEILDTLYRNLGFSIQYELVEDFSTWKQKFIEANKMADIIYLPTNGAIKNWDAKEAVEFVTAHINKPVVTCDDFMMPYCVFGLTKVAEEQGSWAAQTALAILDGTIPLQIPLTRNKQSRSFINSGLAAKIGFKPSVELINRSEIIN